MASGFVVLTDEIQWRVRWSMYDYVLGKVMVELSDSEEELPLKAWLNYILPNEKNGDIESGYCFYKNGSETILRILDMRLMKDEFAKIFWEKVSLLASQLSDKSDMGSVFQDLMECYENSLSEIIKGTPQEDNSWIFFVGGFEIGKHLGKG